MSEPSRAARIVAGKLLLLHNVECICAQCSARLRLLDAFASSSQASAAERMKETCLAAIPTNWCDPMFVGAPSLDGPSVEWALKKIAAAIRALKCE